MRLRKRTFDPLLGGRVGVSQLNVDSASMTRECSTWWTLTKLGMALTSFLPAPTGRGTRETALLISGVGRDPMET
jgi:hypothetical protein